MAIDPPGQPGMALREVDTPALIIDLDAFERNLRCMAAAVAAQGVRLRPHSKTHKSPVIARRQMDLGAVGVCCQKVSEAEIMVEGGIDDVLVSNEIVGERKLLRLAALAGKARIGVCVDDPGNVADIAMAAGKLGVTIQVLVEIDVGAGRCGASPGEPALRVAAAVAEAGALHFAGLQAYHGGAQHIREPAARRREIEKVIDLTRSTVDLLARNGLACDTVSGAGTGTYMLEAAGGVHNEIQAGSYIFMDADYARNRNSEGGHVDTFEQALFLSSTVMSRPVAGRAVVDAGHKAAAIDSGPPELFGLPGIAYCHPSDEHGVLVAEEGGISGLPELGDKLLLVPGHCDPTVNLHDWYICVRGLHGADAHVEAVWPVAARGAFF